MKLDSKLKKLKMPQDSKYDLSGLSDDQGSDSDMMSSGSDDGDSPDEEASESPDEEAAEGDEQNPSKDPCAGASDEELMAEVKKRGLLSQLQHSDDGSQSQDDDMSMNS